MVKLITMKICHDTRDMNTFSMDVIKRVIYWEIVTSIKWSLPIKLTLYFVLNVLFGTVTWLTT